MRRPTYTELLGAPFALVFAPFVVIAWLLFYWMPRAANAAMEYVMRGLR